MAKLVKTKRRRLSFSTKCFIFMMIVLVAGLACSIFVGSINTARTIEIQKIKIEVASLKTTNQQLTIEIQTLQNKDRIYTIAKDAGLDQNQSNVISITQE